MGIKAPGLEPQKHINRLFPGSSHKIKFQIFQNISKYSIHGLIPFKYKNICELCDIKEYKCKRGKIMVNKPYFFMRKLLIYFIKTFIFPK